MPNIEPTVGPDTGAPAEPSASSIRAVLRPQAPSKPDTKRRWLYVFVAGFGVIMAFSMMFTSKPAKNPVASAPKQQAVLSLDPSNMQQKSWQAQSQGDIQQLREELNQVKENDAQLKLKLEQAKASPPTSGNDSSTPDFMRDHANGQIGHSDNLGALPPPPPPLPPLPKEPQGAVPKPGAAAEPAAAPTEQPKEFDAPAAEQADTSSATTSGSTKAGALQNKAAGLSERYARNAYAGYLPAGSFAPIALLHGLDAASGATSQANPQPVLMRLQDNATLPGAAKYQLKSCFMLGSAYGDLSSERVYVRIAQLSCVDKNDRLVLNSKLKGYLVDSDGKLGLRGVLINRQGAKLAAALMAGFAQGLSGAFGASMGTTTMSPMLGAGTTVSGSQAMQMAGMGGVSGAAQQLATFYLQQAQAIYPVISVNAGRTGEIVIEDGTALNWQDTESLYTTTVLGGGAAGAH